MLIKSDILITYLIISCYIIINLLIMVTLEQIPSIRGSLQINLRGNFLV